MLDNTRSKANINQSNSDGWSALMDAAQKGDTTTLKAILNVGADINAITHDKDTALIVAAKNGHIESVLALLDSGADTNIGTEYGWTALIHAARRGYTEILLALLAHGARIDTVPASGMSCKYMKWHSRLLATNRVKVLDPIYLEEGDSKAIRSFIRQSKSSVAQGHIVVIPVALRWMDESGGHWIGFVFTPDAGSVAASYIDPVIDQIPNWILKAFTNTTVKPVLYFRQEDNHACGPMLLLNIARHLEQRIEPNVLNRTFTAAETLLEKMDSVGYTALMHAVENGYIKTATTLLNEGADVNAASEYGWTALMSATRNNHIDMLRMLLTRGAMTQATTLDGTTALDIAEKNNTTEIAKILRSSTLAIQPEIIELLNRTYNAYSSTKTTAQ